MSERVVTRYAPSPTGKQHIGGARTALFAWLWARSARLRGGEGRFLLRIEDTDAARSTRAYEDDIRKSMAWLGLQVDGDIVRQSERVPLYEAAAQELLNNKQAYWCDCNPERLEQLREQSRRSGSHRVYDGHCRDRQLEPSPGCVLRLRAPGGPGTNTEDKTGQQARDWNSWNDAVLGEQKMQLDFDNLDDFVLKRSSDTSEVAQEAAQGVAQGAAGFTYHLCCVVDDSEMGITHVVRGADHVASVARQTLLYLYLNRPLPQWAHLPLVLGTDGSRLSKRQGNQAVLAMRDAGYLPEAVVNFLVRLGWSHGDRELFYSLDDIAEVFAKGQVGRSPAVCDVSRLKNLNGEHLRRLSLEEVQSRLKEFGKEKLSAISDEIAPAVLPLYLTRAETLQELSDSLAQVASTPTKYHIKQQEHTAAEAFTEAEKSVLSQVCDSLQQIAADNWSETHIASVLQNIADQQGGFAKVGKPMRLALTGSTQAPGVAELAAALGRDRTLERLQAAIAA